MVLGSGVSSSSSGSRSVTRSGKKSENIIFGQKRQLEIHQIHVKKQALKTRSKYETYQLYSFQGVTVGI